MVDFTKTTDRTKRRPDRSTSFWDGFWVFAILESGLELIGSIFEGLGSN